MLQDEEFELFVTTPERIQALGFKPQKEVLINYLLPYADELDEESTRFLEQVKFNLGKAVMLREMKSGCGVWSSRLMKYIKLYGLKFSKEDHILLIKLTYELVLIPDLEPSKIHKFATMFQMLTKKRQLISPEELTLPWRPLYEMGQNLFDKGPSCIGMYHFMTPKRSSKEGGGILDLIRKFMSGDGVGQALGIFGLTDPDKDEQLNSLEGSYISLIKCARPYFDVNATKEILATWLPQINPWSTDANVGSQMAVFLPIALPPHLAQHGHLLWFDELMTLWDTCYNSQNGISDLMMLFAGLAKRNPGAVDWTPHVPKMFTRFIHALNLPVGYKDMQLARAHSLDMKHVTSWIVWSISPNGVVLKHLRSFLAGVESYLHSANAGRWSFKLRDLLRKLAKEFVNRYRREREPRFQDTWENKIPESYKLRDEDITEFVNIVFEPTLQAVYTRTGTIDISLTLQSLATLRPAIVIPPLLEKLRTSITSLTEPHRVTAAFCAVTAVARPMLRGAGAGYPEGPTNVIPLLMAVLPGLDANDLRKTIVTLQFIVVFVWMVPIIDCSTAYEHWSDLTEEELLTCESTAQFEDFVIVFLDRLFLIIESSVHEHIRLDTNNSDWVRSKTDATVESSLASAVTAVIMQCSPQLFRVALRKFKLFATSTTFETNVSGSIIGLLLRVFARVDSELTLAAFLPDLCEELTELLATDEALHEENPPRELTYRLVLLKHVVECDGTVLLNYMPVLIPILDRLLKLHSNYALTRACDTLSHILNSLCFRDLKEWKSSPKDYGEAPQKWLPIREWGYGCLLKDANFKWHIPNEEEAACAQMLVDRYLKAEVVRLRQWLNDERPMCRERRLRSLNIIKAMLSCSTLLPTPDEEPVALVDSLVPATNIPFNYGFRHEVTLDGENVRVAMTNLLLGVQTRLIAEQTDDTRGLEMIIHIWERVVIVKGLRGGLGLESRLRKYGALERGFDGRGGADSPRSAGSARLRMLAAEAVRLHEDTRYDLMCDAGITQTALKALHALTDLCIHTYSSVRIPAQIRLYWMLSHYPYSYRALVPKLASILIKGGEGDEWHARHKGVLYMMLGPRNAPLIAKQDWNVARTLWPAVLNAPLSEKQTMVTLLQVLSDSLHRNFPTVNTRLAITQAAVDAAAPLLTEEQLSNAKFIEGLNNAMARELATSDRTERIYTELIDELVKVIETPNVPWRRLELAIQMLTYCPSIQTPYPASAVRAIVKSLLHDNITVRRVALRLTHYALKQRKRTIKKILIDPYEMSGVERPEKNVPGYRKDLEWAIWSEDNIPKTDEDWDKPWLRNPTFGFYAWPDKLEVAAPTSEQIYSSELTPDQMEEGERYMFEFFSDDDNLDKLVAFLTVEDKQGKDKFNGTRFSMFRLLFAHFGGDIAAKLMAHAERCAEGTQEAPQRFAAEITAAAFRAPRYWPRVRAQNMYKAALRILETGLSNVTSETVEDWGTCVANGLEKMDPMRGSQILLHLLQLCTPAPRDDMEFENDTSSIVCARLYALQALLGALRWRGATLASQVLKRLEEANFIQHPYQNVRESVGSVLMTIFDTELVFPGGQHGGAPCLVDFLASVQPKLAALYDENGDIVIKTASTSVAMQCSGRSDATEVPVLSASRPAPAVPLVDVGRLSPDSHAPVPETPPQPAEGGESSDTEMAVESRMSKQLVGRLDSSMRLAGDTVAPAPQDHARALNLLATVLRGLMGVVVRAASGTTAMPYGVLSTACALAARGPPQPNDELPRAAASLLAALALAVHSAHTYDVTLQHLERLADSRSWWARLACLDFAQPLLFYGLPMMCDQVERADRAEAFALKLMRDRRLEVRQSAAKLLTGLMHCRALRNENRTLRALMKSCRSKELVERHYGVLGLCAYLLSRPYSLGPRLGDVLAELARHTSAPDPIPATIQTSMADFRRTHQDDWANHRAQLTEEELDLLVDLVAPPSYFA